MASCCAATAVDVDVGAVLVRVRRAATKTTSAKLMIDKSEDQKELRVAWRQRFASLFFLSSAGLRRYEECAPAGQRRRGDLIKKESRAESSSSSCSAPSAALIWHEADLEMRLCAAPFA